MLSELTPTAKSSFIAGLGLSILGWVTALHLDAVAELLHVDKWCSTKKTFDWIADHKILTFLGLEIGAHTARGIDDPNAVTFTAGSTVINFIVLAICVPIWRWISRESAIR